MESELQQMSKPKPCTVEGRIIWSNDGGPIRHILNGRKRVPTGFFVSRKMNGIKLPWESKRCELPMLRIAEISTAVRSFLSQPHRLELTVSGERRKRIYFPDLFLELDADFFRTYDPELPFGKQLLEWRPRTSERGSYRRVIVELKDERDERMLDADYVQKLRMASHVYEKAHISFITAYRRKDIETVSSSLISRISADSFLEVSYHDFEKVQRLLSVRSKCTLAELICQLGGGPNAIAILHALHIQRAICLDISSMRPESLVFSCSTKAGE